MGSSVSIELSFKNGNMRTKESKLILSIVEKYF